MKRIDSTDSKNRSMRRLNVFTMKSRIASTPRGRGKTILGSKRKKKFDDNSETTMKRMRIIMTPMTATQLILQSNSMITTMADITLSLVSVLVTTKMRRLMMKRIAKMIRKTMISMITRTSDTVALNITLVNMTICLTMTSNHSLCSSRIRCTIQTSSS